MPEELQTPSSVEQCSPAPQVADDMHVGAAALQPLNTMSRVHLLPLQWLGPQVGWHAASAKHAAWPLPAHVSTGSGMPQW
jgi:hypothetical protein